MHNDLIMTAKQKRLEAGDFIGARVTSPHWHFNFKLLSSWNDWRSRGLWVAKAPRRRS